MTDGPTQRACHECGQPIEDDPDGSPGVLVHARALGDEAYDLDADHNPLDESVGWTLPAASAYAVVRIEITDAEWVRTYGMGQLARELVDEIANLDSAWTPRLVEVSGPDEPTTCFVCGCAFHQAPCRTDGCNCNTNPHRRSRP